MHDNGEAQNRIIRPEFNRSILIEFLGAKITSDAGFLVLREIDERFKVTAPMGGVIEDQRSPVHLRHSMVEMIRQRVYQFAAGYEDCIDADQLRIDPALRLALGKDHKKCAGQSMMSKLENDYLGNGQGLMALEKALARPADALLRRKNKRRLIVDFDSTEDPAHGKQENVGYNGHFGKNCFHPRFGFTSEGDCLAAKLRPGNVHSADGTLDMFRPIVERYRSWFQLFWFRGMLPLPIRRFTSSVRIPGAGSHTSSAYRLTRIYNGWSSPIFGVRLAGRPRVASRPRSLISITGPKAGTSLAG